MEFKKNPELIEKPNHAHYPICRGRLDEINEISRKTLFYTLGASALMALLSLLATPLHVVGWIPLMFTFTDTKAFGMGAAFAIVQFIMCLVLCVIALLGCTRHKIFTAVMSVIYTLMLICSMVANMTRFDIITAFIGAGGIYASWGAIKGYIDHKQLRNTEGYPIFSTVLADHDDQKQLNPNGYNKKHFDKLLREKALRERNIDPNTANSSQAPPNLAQPQSAAKNDIGEMPALNVTRPVRNSSVERKFVPKDHKEVFFSDSTLKMK